MNGWWQRWRRARALERRAIPDALWQLTLARFPFLAARSDGDLRELREMATLFLATKEFNGTRGLEITVADGPIERGSQVVMVSG